MRFSKVDGKLRLRVISGTHVILIAIDLDENERPGLRGFAIKRGKVGEPKEWLKGIKYFEDTVSHHTQGDVYSSREQPFQSLLWSDYSAAPGTGYDFTVVALYGPLGHLQGKLDVSFSIRTEDEISGSHGVWFNRGTIASHAFETNFHNKHLTDQMAEAVSDDGQLLDEETRWLSRGLAEACLKFINETKAHEGLRVCAYEFTYVPVLKALKRALERGVDVQIIYHDTTKADDRNRKAIESVGLPAAISRASADRTILFKRTRTSIPHNKFIVKLVGGKPSEVWTGSTNFTNTGFFGQTNVGHLVREAVAAKTYLDYWTRLSDDPVHSVAVDRARELTPNPPNAVKAVPLSQFFSPRKADNMLDWYGQRITDTAHLAMMTIPFNVASQILDALGAKRDAMRLVVLEDLPTPEVLAAEKSNRGKLAFTNGAILGKSFIKIKSGVGGANVVPIANSELDKWFVDEELARPTNSGHVFFIHTKILLVDPLSNDPLVCSGSANFSTNSLIANDENMLLIRGDTRVADIYMTEIDRIFRHFYSRNMANSMAGKGTKRNPLALDITDSWIGPNFTKDNYKNNRRLLFFPEGTGPKPTWVDVANRDPDPFLYEDQRAAELKRKKASSRAVGTRPSAAKKPAATAQKKHVGGEKKTSSKRKGASSKTSTKTLRSRHVLKK